MRTTVTLPNDDQDTDEFPGCSASVDDRGVLVITDADSNVEATYDPHEWADVEIVNDDRE